VQYHRPQNLDDALNLLFAKGGTAVPLAGGTRFVPRQSTIADNVVDLQAVGLDTISSSDHTLTLGSMVKLQSLVNAAGAPDVLSASAWREGNVNLRNMATVGGTVVVADPSSELLTALLAFDAQLTLYTPTETRRSLPDYLTQREQYFGLITQVELDTRGRSASARLARTPADAPIIAATVRLVLNGDHCEQAFIALAGVAERPIRLPEAEAVLAGRSLTPERLDALAETVSQAISPPSDYRGSSDYRRQMAGVIVRRAVTLLSE